MSLLVEGNSIRSIERITGVHRDTIMRLMERIGLKCYKILDLYMRQLTCQEIECDELWTFIQKKQRKLKPEDNPDWGDQYCFVALDPRTKLIPVFTVGKRNFETTREFIAELRNRVVSRFQLTTDYFPPYTYVVPMILGGNLDYAQLQKMYHGNGTGREGYSPSDLLQTETRNIIGQPKRENICTSYVERQNLTIRMQLRRFTRLTNAFSKKLDNLRYALALYFFFYNFMRTHRTLGTTPAMEAGITGKTWMWEDLLN